MAATAKNAAESQLIENGQESLRTAARRAYSDQRDNTLSNEQITELLPMVRRIVQRVITYLKPPLSFEDLVSAGTVGLIKAARDYNPSRQAEFKTYAYIRIRGAVLDELRSWSFVPANVDRQIRKTLRLSLEITDRTGSAPTDDELAERLDISIEKLHEVFENARARHFVSVDGAQPDSLALGRILGAANTAAPDEQFEKNELIDRLTKAIQQLDQRQRQIILLYYQQELTMKQIAEVFNITEPRVSQLHAKALFHLAVKLRKWNDGV